MILTIVIRGILTTTAFNLEVADVFSYEDESIGFVWEANDTVLQF